jgi:putative MATE family efflux protein
MSAAALPREADAGPCPPPALGRPAWRLVLALAWPALVQNWLAAAVHLSDRWLAGYFRDPAAGDPAAVQAAQTTAVYLGWFLSSYTSLVCVGSTALVARLIGAGDRAGARRVLHQSLLLALAFGLAGTVLGLACLQPALVVLRLHGEAAGYAADYLRPLLYQLPVQMVGMAGIACLVGAGDTRTALAVLGGVTVLNLPLAWLFFHGAGPLPGLGFTGIAAGTALSQALGGLAVLAVLLRGRAGLRLRPRQLWPRPDLLARLLRVSVPAAIDSLSMQVGYLWFLGIVNGLGATAAAAHGIAVGWEALGFQSGAAFGTAATAVVGQHLGAGRPDRAARGGWVAFALGAALMSLMGAVFFSLAGPMFALFCPRPEQAGIVEAGVPVLRLIAFGMPALASCMILAWALRGAGDTRAPMLFTWVGFFAVRIPLAYLLTGQAAGGWDLGLMGAWLAMFTDVQVRGLCVLARFASGRWKLVRV